jgi:hypothetical protein
MRAAAMEGSPGPLPVICMVEHLHRDRALADAVCQGRFTHLNIALDLGLDPDWRFPGPPEDAEWRIEWSKFYYGLDLAHAFRETGDPTYLRTWERLVLSWIGQVPVDFDPADVTGRRVQNWVYAWSIFSRAPHFPGFAHAHARRILASLDEQVRYLRDHLAPERNHRTLELYALFIVGLAFPELDPGGALLDFAMRELHQNLLADVLPDGVHREGSTHYHMVVLRSFLGARANASLFGLQMPPGYDERLEKACEFALHCHRPDGQIPALSDSDRGSYVDLLALASRLLHRPDFLYVATSGGAGKPPAERGRDFLRGGYFFQRSGWGEGEVSFADERFLAFDCGPLGDGGHGHYDLLSVEISAHGRPLLVDPGRYSYSEHGPNWRRWFKGTAAHNTVCVDGLDQTPYSCGKPKSPVAEARLCDHLRGRSLDLLCGQAVSPCYDAVHTRRVLFVFNEYWIIEDRLTGMRPHHYDLRFHLPPEASAYVEMTAGDGGTRVEAPGLTLLIWPPGENRLEPGWVAPRYGQKLPAPVVCVGLRDVAEARFLTLVIPSRGRSSAPSLNVCSGTKPSSSGMTVEITGVGPDGRARDQVTWTESIGPFGIGPFSGRAALAALREDVSGKPMSFEACQVTGSVQGPSGATMRSESASVDWVSWDPAQCFREGRA